MSARFQGLVDPATGCVLFSQQASSVRPANAVDLRGMAVSPEGFICSINDTGQPRVFQDGIAIERDTGLVLTSSGPVANISMGGLAVTAAGAVVIKNPPDVIHQGVALTNAGEICKGVLFGYQAIVDPADTQTSDWARDSDRGYREISTRVSFNNGSTLMFVPAENDIGGTVSTSITNSPDAETSLNVLNNWFTLPIYLRNRDFDRFIDAGGVTYYCLVSNEKDATTNYVLAPWNVSHLAPGWSWYFFPPLDSVITGKQLSNYISDPVQGGNGITTQTGLVRHRCDLFAAAQLIVGTSISNIDTITNRITFTSAHDLLDSDAIYFGATTVPGGTTPHVPYFAKEIDTTTIELYEDPDLNTQVNFSSTGTAAELYHTPQLHLGPLLWGGDRKKYLCLTIDDGTVETFTEWYEGASLTESFKDLGWPATTFIISSFIDAGGSLTTAQTQTLYNDGWTVGNHSSTAEGASSLTASQLAANFATCQAYIQNNNWGNGDICSWPGGAFTDTNYLDNYLEAAYGAGMRYGRTTHAGFTSRGAVPAFWGLQPNTEGHIALKMWAITCNADNPAAGALQELDYMISLGIPLLAITLHRVKTGATGEDISPAEADALIAGIKTRWQAGSFEIVSFESAITGV